jgi:hypothetical protein
MSDRNIKKNAIHTVILFSIVCLVVSCGASDPNHPKADKDKAIVSSCLDLKKIGISQLTSTDQTQLCQIMADDLGRNPPVYLLRDLFRLASLVKETASDEPINKIAAQAMQVVQIRKQQNDDAAIQNTFDTIWKIYQSTETKVGFNDLAEALKNSGDKASLISDDQLEVLAINLWQTIPKR